ncbi:hypothetical protein [Enterovibrio norvegicus]|uniref:Uncharacterized protein n=1 Tax=Enterovibrio norvegicus TaxID=188144 RepID=A0A2N7L537_9GAMM|nr:hypothetical protein [Enterovibrio norvegicus]PMN88629.1 hypothetical protein BCT23_23940 [Enterovibrio norvegicus]
MYNETDIIDNLQDLETFLIAVENGGLGLKDVAGVALATNNSDGRPFVAVLGDDHQLLLARWVTQDVFDNGKDLVRSGPKKH